MLPALAHESPFLMRRLFMQNSRMPAGVAAMQAKTQQMFGLIDTTKEKGNTCFKKSDFEVDLLLCSLRST